MRIGIDVRILQESGAARGIATYIRGLLAGFESAGLADRVARFRYLAPEPAGVPPQREWIRLRRTWRERRVLADGLNQVMTPLEVALAGVDVFHAPSPYDLAWWYPCPLVVTVHDMAPVSQPVGIVRTGLEHRWLYRFLRRAARVITVSEFSRGEILRHLPIAPERVVVVPEAAQPGLAPAHPPRVDAVLARHRILSPYLLHVGGYDRLEPRKDVGTLLAAFRLLANERRDLTLVLAGGGGGGLPALEQAIAREGLNERVVRTGYVSTDDLAALYSGSTALLFPSTYEGFGLPVLEAFACGVPVVAARAGSLPEIGGDAALFAEPGDAPGLARLARELLDRPEIRRERIERGWNRVAEFSWERTARLTWEVHREAASDRPSWAAETSQGQGRVGA